MDNGAGHRAASPDVEGSAGVAAAVASVAGFVAELTRITVCSPDAAPVDTDPAADPDPLQEFADQCLDGLAVVRKIEAATAALKVRLVDGHVKATAAMADPASRPEWVSGREMAAVAEVACVLTIGERAAGALITEAHALTSSLPAALDALQAGEVPWQNARILVDETTGLDPAATAALEAQFLAKETREPLLNDGVSDPQSAPCLAGELPAARFRRKVRTWRERHHPESLEKRHAKGLADRRMECSPDRDGMAWVSLYLPADQSAAIWNRTTALARGLRGPDEPRTVTQLRPDIAASLLLGAGLITAGSDGTRGGSDGTRGASGAATSGSGAAVSGSEEEPPQGIGHASLSHEAAAPEACISNAGGTLDADGPKAPCDCMNNTANESYFELGKPPAPPAQVLVTVPVFSLLGLTEEPAMLDGHGPIPASMARNLVADGAGSFYRVLVDPRDGAPLEIGRTSYRLTKAMRNWLRMRDGKCPFPGCSNHSLDNEADHILAWAKGGTTGISNLGQPCPKHHRLRHTTGWKPTPATKNEPPGWTSPTGRKYKSEHQDWEPPHWPPALPDGKSLLEEALLDRLSA